MLAAIHGAYLLYNQCSILLTVWSRKNSGTTLDWSDRCVEIIGEKYNSNAVRHRALACRRWFFKACAVPQTARRSNSPPSRECSSLLISTRHFLSVTFFVYYSQTPIREDEINSALVLLCSQLEWIWKTVMACFRLLSANLSDAGDLTHWIKGEGLRNLPPALHQDLRSPLLPCEGTAYWLFLPNPSKR